LNLSNKINKSNNPSKPIYELFRPYPNYRYHDARQYMVIVQKDGKRYGYIKLHGESAKYVANPHTGGLKFCGYMKEKAFEEMIFVDLL